MLDAVGSFALESCCGPAPHAEVPPGCSRPSMFSRPPLLGMAPVPHPARHADVFTSTTMKSGGQIAHAT